MALVEKPHLVDGTTVTFTIHPSVSSLGPVLEVQDFSALGGTLLGRLPTLIAPSLPSIACPLEIFWKQHVSWLVRSIHMKAMGKTYHVTMCVCVCSCDVLAIDKRGRDSRNVVKISRSIAARTSGQFPWTLRAARHTNK